MAHSSHPRPFATWLRLAPACAALCACVLALGSVARAADDDSDKPDPAEQGASRIKWVHGPQKVQLGSIASLDLPAGYRFADSQGTRAVLEATHNPPEGNELGCVIPEDGSWFLIYSYEDVGHVPDDEKNSLDDETTDKLLESIREGTEQGNRVRASHGWDPIHIAGWEQRPFYDQQTQHLTWAIRTTGNGKGDSTGSVNYNSKLLGRTGVISATLIIEPASLSATVPTYRTLVKQVTFNPGSRYEEFRQGDKIAHYGLIGLVTGGAAIAVVKGWKFFAKIGALLLAGGAAALRGLKNKLFGKSAAAR